MRYILVAAVIAAYSIALYALVSDQIDDYARVNGVGRLRMLTQKITKDALLYRKAPCPAKPCAHRSEFPFIAARRDHGGPVQLDIEGMERRELPMTEDRRPRVCSGIFSNAGSPSGPTWNASSATGQRSSGMFWKRTSSFSIPRQDGLANTGHASRDQVTTRHAAIPSARSSSSTTAPRFTRE